MLNPQTATIGMPDGSIVNQFRLKYLYAGSPVATLLVTANYVTTSGGVAQFVQALGGLNALVPLNKQGASLVLTASAINDGGESTAFSCSTEVVVINAPAAPVSITLS